MKKESEIKKTILITAVLMLISFVSCGEEEIKSYWLENDITIDGDQMDWQGKLHYLADEHSALGIANDDENLFLCLATNNTAKMFQFFVTGFTVWFEPQNGDEKIGVQYPLKSDDIKRMMQMRNRPGEGPDFKIRLAEFKNLQNEIRIVNEDNFPLTAYSLNNEIGIEVDVGYQMGQLVYEMRIPISKPLFGDHNLNLLPGDKVTLAFESGKFDRSDSGVREKRPGFGMGGGGGGRGRGGSGSGGGGSPSGRSRNSGFEQISFEVEVTLAKKSATN